VIKESSRTGNGQTLFKLGEQLLLDVRKHCAHHHGSKRQQDHRQ
jgi:hypothetical protein